MNISNTLNLSGLLYEESNDEDKRKILYEFVTNGVLLNVIGILGIFGNIISMIILSRPQMKSSINYLLIGLARCDTVLIITSVLLFGIPAIFKYTGYLFIYYFKVYPHLVRVIYPLALIAQTVSVYLTLTVTLERFVAVCHPLQARSMCTYGRARLYVILIIVFSTLYNLPRFWEVQLVELTYDSKYNTTLYEVSMTQLRDNPVYISIYIHWLYLIFIYFLPFTSLAVLNAAIYQQVRRANQERQRLSRQQKKEIGLATMLLCVVVVFFLCNILALVNNVLEAFYGSPLDQVVRTSDMLITINSSVNFIIYVIFGEKFKRLFLKLFCSRGWMGVGGRDSPDANTHDDSVVSNGDGRNYSLRNSHMYHLHRTGTTVVRNGSTTSGNSNSMHCSTRIPRAPSPGPCVYYPARPICPSVVTAVRHPEVTTAGENVSGKQQRCNSSAVASNKGVLDQTQADFHPRGRINDTSSASAVSASVVGNMRLVDHRVEGGTDVVINGVGQDIEVEQNSVKYRSRMGEEKYVKVSSASRTIVDNCVVNMTKNRFVMGENNNCQHSNDDCDSDSSEELQYGPGIVNKLKCKYMSMTLRENQNKGVRPSLSNLRRATSLENMFDNDSDTGKPQITQTRFTKRTDATNNSNKTECTSENQQRYRPTSRRNDSMKRARSVETLLRYDPKSQAATGHSIPSDLPVCDHIVKPEFRDYNKNNTRLLKALGNEEIVIVENKMKVECNRKTVSEEKAPMFQQKKRTSNISEETELPPPDVVKQTMKIFEGTSSKKTSRLTRAPGVSLKSAPYKHGGVSLSKVSSNMDELKGSLNTKPLLSPKPVISTEKYIPNTHSLRKFPPSQLPPDVQHSTSPTLNSRILAVDTLSPLVGPTGATKLKSSSPTESGKKIIGIPSPQVDDPICMPAPLTNGKITGQDLIVRENNSSGEDDDDDDDGDGSADAVDGATKVVSNSALNNIRKDGMSVEFKFGSSTPSTKSKSYLPGANSYLPTGQTSVPSKIVTRNQKVTSPALERRDFLTAAKSTSVAPVVKSPDSPQNQMKQVCVIRPIVNNSHPTSPPPSLTDREIEKNFINRTKSIEQPTSKVVVSLKSANDVVVGKVLLEPTKGHTGDSVKSVNDSVTFKSTSEAKGSGLWDNKPWNQPQNTMVFNFSGRKGPVPSYIENDGLILSNRKNKSSASDYRKINLDGTSDESSTDIDTEDCAVGLGGPPSPCNVLFEGDNVLINGKSNLLKKPKQHKLRIKFDDAATTTFEYPSEASLLSEKSSPPSSLSSPAGLPHPTSPNGPTPGIPVPLGGSGLASYTPSKIHLGSEDFQLGVTRAAPLLPHRTTDMAVSSGSKQTEEEEEEDYLKPAEDSETVAWSSETASDLLF